MAKTYTAPVTGLYNISTSINTRRSNRHKLTKEEHNKRLVARWKIIQAANNHKRRFGQNGVLFGIRQIQRAVFICRQRQLVKPELLKEAGFNG